LAGNESQWPTQYPHDNWHAADGQAAPQDDRPTEAAPVAPATPPVPPTTPYGPPATPYVPPPAPQAPQSPAAGYPVPPAGYHVPPGGYHVPAAGYPAASAGYQLPLPGYPVPSGGYQAQARMRAAAADRERAVDVLKAGFAEGRLTQDEYNERMGRAYAARTYGELMALTADLPAGAVPAVWPVAVYQPPVTTNSLARASLVLGVAEFFTMGLTAIPAIICGHMAKREMRQTGQRGEGLATSGLVLGYMAVIFWGILIALSVVSAVITASGTGG
jgi:Domain of unknown function (DUF1707)/Domain of unknown function (DUF4190)